MMNKQEIRRAVIREWMALPHDKRQTEEQTSSFAVMAAQRHELPRSRNNACQVMMGWLLPRTGRL
jgi:hypothetical protein